MWQPPAEPSETAGGWSLELATAGITSVIWCTGFRSDYHWIEVPIFDGRGYPVHARGITAVGGLYFLGLPWLHTWGSGRFSGDATDAEYLGERIQERVVAAPLARPPALNELALGS